jgi:hypothetical protein
MVRFTFVLGKYDQIDLAKASPLAPTMLLFGNPREVVSVEDLGGVYHPRQSKLSQFYQCIEDHFVRLEKPFSPRPTLPFSFFPLSIVVCLVSFGNPSFPTLASWVLPQLRSEDKKSA